MRRTVVIRVVHQGRAQLTEYSSGFPLGVELRSGDEVAVFYVNMETKYCAVDGFPVDFSDVPIPQIRIVTTEDSRNLGKNDGDTIIGFPEYVGWGIWFADVSKYFLRVCLVKEEEI